MVTTRMKWPTKEERHTLFGSVPPAPGTKPTQKEEMVDLQNEDKDFLFSIQAVGVSRVKHPIVVVSNNDPQRQTTIAEFTMTTSLSREQKGINMSRLTEVLHEFYEKEGFVLSLENIAAFTKELADRMNQQCADVEVSFPWFIERKSPVLKKAGMMHAKGTLKVSYDETKGIRYRGGIEAAITTLCPCSKEISEYSAHNQRGFVTVEADFDGHKLGESWKECLLGAAESNASSMLYPVLKRPDEKAVTEGAYENPRFVEDLARLVAADLYEEEAITCFTVECRNEESIHLHDAVGRIEINKKE
ncbi:GTP cyclohydrolase FolE2 [Alteribacter aurantiacus]|uniref:GTP cyclohydrolase FolE2 n=1 Tax=Alteribacter aurantiacus TaxID=254410 RepID=UPI000428E595|nr:GTP cyclohydrolase FolE2 [Alteribacter aurantiacus]